MTWMDASALSPQVWLILDSCGDATCDCGSVAALGKHDDPGAAVFDVHLSLTGEDWYADIETAIAVYLDDLDGSVPFSVADLRCMHSPEVHTGPMPVGIPVQEVQACNYRGIIVRGGAAPRLIVFQRYGGRRHMGRDEKLVALMAAHAEQPG